VNDVIFFLVFSFVSPKAFVETRAYALFQTQDFLNLSESMVQMIMCRNLEIPEVRKFEAMLAWAKNKVSWNARCAGERISNLT
jgi:hypothetical protein